MNTRHTVNYYKHELKSINHSFFLILDELTNAFPYTKTYPNIQSYSDKYSKDTGNMNQVRSDLYILKDTLQQDITSASNRVKMIIARITKIEKDNAKLQAQLRILENKREGAIGFYDDNVKLYNLQFLENVIMSICIVGLGYKIYHDKL